MQNNNEFEKENVEYPIDLPERNEESIPLQEEKKIIEIPQEYYDKINQEKLEKERLEKSAEEQRILEKKETASSIKRTGKILVNLLLIFLCLYGTLHFNRYCLIILPIYILVASVFFAKKEKKNSDFSITILLGGIFLAILSFLFTITNETKADLGMYYTVASIVTGFVGLITANILTWFIVEHKNIKALQTIGFFAYFVILIGAPYVLYNKFPEEFVKIVFQEQPEVKAETEKEFIEKTLKYRYGETFTCTEEKTFIDERKQKGSISSCVTEQGTKISVTATAYEESNVLYTVMDNYMSVLYLDSFKETLEKELGTLTNASITIRLYPKTKCSFVGDCVECDEYIAYEKEEKDKNNLYENSSKLNLEKYKNMANATDFVNEYQFKYIIKVVGQYGGLMEDRYEEIVNSILTQLNNKGLENTFGYEIILRNSNELNKMVYKVKGTTNNEKTFKDPIVEDIK